MLRLRRTRFDALLSAPEGQRSVAVGAGPRKGLRNPTLSRAAATENPGAPGPISVAAARQSCQSATSKRLSWACLLSTSLVSLEPSPLAAAELPLRAGE